MLKTLSYENKTLENLQRINIIVGENGSGKTSVLNTIVKKGAIILDADLKIKENLHINTWGPKVLEGIVEIFTESNNLLLEIIKTMSISPQMNGKDIRNDKGCLFDKLRSHLNRGLYKKLAIHLALGKARQTPIKEYSILCIDEFENSLYCDTIDSIWKSIDDYSKQYNIQLFITTHSMECIQSLIDNVPDTDIALYRLEEERVVRYDREGIEISLDNDWELR